VCILGLQRHPLCVIHHNSKWQLCVYAIFLSIYVVHYENLYFTPHHTLALGYGGAQSVDFASEIGENVAFVHVKFLWGIYGHPIGHNQFQNIPYRVENFLEKGHRKIKHRVASCHTTKARCKKKTPYTVTEVISIRRFFLPNPMPQGNNHCCLISFFSDCRYMPCEDTAGQSCAIVRRRDFLRHFCVLYFQRAACSTFQTCILISH